MALRSDVEQEITSDLAVKVSNRTPGAGNHMCSGSTAGACVFVNRKGLMWLEWLSKEKSERPGWKGRQRPTFQSLKNHPEHFHP